MADEKELKNGVQENAAEKDELQSEDLENVNGGDELGIYWSGSKNKNTQGASL